MRPFGILFLAAVLVVFSAGALRAEEVEVGTSMVSVLFGMGGDNEDLSAIGTPAAGFGILQPTLYGSFFVNARVSVEPQLGLVWVSQNGESVHFYHASVQGNYFLRGSSVRSPYVFGSLGVIDYTQSAENPKSLTFGGGYRIPVGGRLTFRVDGRFSHLTEGGGNTLNINLSIGGLFGG